VSGKEYVKQAMDLVEAVISGISQSNVLNGDVLIAGTKKALGDLDGLKNKATLRTKEGTNQAFPVFEAARNLDEAWEDAKANDDTDDLKWRLEGFIDAVVALGGVLKDRTVIMT
jgi:hypothetical protein